MELKEKSFFERNDDFVKLILFELCKRINLLKIIILIRLLKVLIMTRKITIISMKILIIVLRLKIKISHIVTFYECYYSHLPLDGQHAKSI